MVLLKIINSYLVLATQDTLKTLTTDLTTQSETESISLHLLSQMFLNLAQYTDKNLPNKTRSQELLIHQHHRFRFRAKAKKTICSFIERSRKERF